MLAADRVRRPTNLDCLRQASAAPKVQVAIRKRLGRIAWLPIGLIGLENAVGRVVAAKYGAGSIAEWTPATLSGECEAQAYGGVRTLAWEEARAWILGHLQAEKLTWNREIIVPALRGLEADRSACLPRTAAIDRVALPFCLRHGCKCQRATRSRRSDPIGCKTTDQLAMR